MSITVEIRNPKLEIRNKSQYQKPNYQNPGDKILLYAFWNWDLFRISDFDIRIFTNRGLPRWRGGKEEGPPAGESGWPKGVQRDGFGGGKQRETAGRKASAGAESLADLG
jgi:hypothetical protein